jgi:3-oxoacyl-[acyl-carrier-protein] synthase-1
MALSFPLDIAACGAVTAVGLDSRQTCAAVRAKVAGFGDAYPRLPPLEPVRGGRVPATARIKGSEAEWLANLATRAIAECLSSAAAQGRIGIIVNVPESFRNHPALAEQRGADLLSRLRRRFESRSSHALHVIQQGHAGVLGGIELAAAAISAGKFEGCVVCGVDSLLNKADITRLAESDRLRGPDNPEGLIPGEASAAILVVAPQRTAQPIARLCGVGLSAEADTVLGPRYSQGRGLQAALAAAINRAGAQESIVGFRVSDMNGERYRAWESLFVEARFYRTWRARLPPWYFTTSVGDVGAASGALAVVLAATGISRGYAPARWAMCECSSDEGLRAACLVGPAPVESNASHRGGDVTISPR